MRWWPRSRDYRNLCGCGGRGQPLAPGRSAGHRLAQQTPLFGRRSIPAVSLQGWPVGSSCELPTRHGGFPRPFRYFPSAEVARTLINGRDPLRGVGQLIQESLEGEVPDTPHPATSIPPHRSTIARRLSSGAGRSDAQRTLRCRPVGTLFQ
jgi:hypothetical protein